jgi:hypothetical protein
MIVCYPIAISNAVKFRLFLFLTNWALCHEDWGSGYMDPHFLSLGTSWRWVVSFTPWPLHPRYPLCRRLDGPQSRYGQHGEEKILYPTGTPQSSPHLSLSVHVGGGGGQKCQPNGFPNVSVLITSVIKCLSWVWWGRIVGGDDTSVKSMSSIKV